MAREIKPYEELELKDDFMFGLIMHDSKYVKPFLEMILKIKIRKVVYPQTSLSIMLHRRQHLMTRTRLTAQLS